MVREGFTEKVTFEREGALVPISETAFQTEGAIGENMPGMSQEQEQGQWGQSEAGKWD